VCELKKINVKLNVFTPHCLPYCHSNRASAFIITTSLFYEVMAPSNRASHSLTTDLPEKALKCHLTSRSCVFTICNLANKLLLWKTLYMANLVTICRVVWEEMWTPHSII
jgi:hypothetical protein